ncbi:hypothetical protein Bhyg_01623, partial [Pseudolycoriella hygida]
LRVSSANDSIDFVPKKIDFIGISKRSSKRRVEATWKMTLTRSSITAPAPETTTCAPEITTTPKPQPPWKAGVDSHSQKCQAALKFYVGPTYKTAKTLLDAFLALIPKLETLTQSRSNILSSNSIAILETISIMSNVGNSPKGILDGFQSVLHIVAADYRSIISSLEVYIDIDTSVVTNAITDLEASIYQIIVDYQNADPLTVCDDKIDYEPVLKSIQNLTNAVASIAKSSRQVCKNDADARDALYILAIIFDHLVIIGHATNVSIAAELNKLCGTISKPWSQCLNVIDRLVSGITEALSALVRTVLEAVELVLEAIVDLAKSLNAVLKSVFGIVQNVTKTLTKTVSGTLTGVTGSLGGITKILNA